MASIGTIKDEMHRADCAPLDILLAEAQDMVETNPEFAEYFNRHIFREYNRRRYFICGGGDMLTPYDGGFAPIGVAPATSVEFLLLESGEAILLEDGTNILLE